MPLLSKLHPNQKLVFLVIFGSALLINLVNWYYGQYTLKAAFRIPAIFWEGIVLLALISWNPRGIRLFLLAVLGFFISQLIITNFIVGGMSTLPFWYLFRDVYGLLKLDSSYAFLIESILLLSMTASLFFGKRRINSGLIDDDL